LKLHARLFAQIKLQLGALDWLRLRRSALLLG
jgi:hypothetical protein